MTTRVCRVGVLLALAAGAAACGHKGPPVPPLPHFPMTPSDVSVRQRDDALEVTASYRLVGLDGGAIRPPVGAELLYTQPRTASDTGGWDQPGREREFLRIAKPLALPAFDAAALGTAVARRDRVPLGTAIPADQALVLAVRVVDHRVPSFPSRRLVLTPARPPLPALEALLTVPEEKGVRLQWPPPADGRGKFVRLYRHLAGTPEPWTAWRIVKAAEGGLLDETAHYGDDVTYAATVSANDGDVAVESAPRTTTVQYRDVFPPFAPSDIGAAPESRSIHVFWYPGGSPDEAGALVERQVEGEPGFREIGKVEAPESFFNDENVDPTRRYRYRVIAVDRAGNQARAAGPTDWLSPVGPTGPDGRTP